MANIMQNTAAKWKIDTLGNVADIWDNLRKPIKSTDRVKGCYPYYGATGIVDYINDYIFNERLLLIGEDGAKWESGDRTAFIAEGKYWVNNHAHVVKVKECINDKYLELYFTALDLTPYITGVTVPKLNQKNLMNIKIPIPPLSEQKRIVAELDAITQHITELNGIYTQKLHKLHDLRQSVLQSAFRGAL